MGEPHVVSALREKRAEISGAILELEKRMAQHRADLVHLDATLRLFAPELELESIAPKKPPAARSHYFDRRAGAPLPGRTAPCRGTCRGR